MKFGIVLHGRVCEHDHVQRGHRDAVPRRVADPVRRDCSGLPAFWLSILQILAFVVKVGAMLVFYMWIRWTIPRFRYDQLMNLGWKVMLPLALLNVVITGAWLWWFGR